MKIENKNKRREINESIAKLLGFKKLTAKKYRVGFFRNMAQWVYPANFQDCQYGTPENKIPDFLYMIETYINFVQNNTLVPKEHEIEEID